MISAVVIVLGLFFVLYLFKIVVLKQQLDDIAVKRRFKKGFLNFVIISILLILVSMQGQGNIFAWFTEVGSRWLESNLASYILVSLLFLFIIFLFYFLFYGILFVFRKFLKQPMSTLLSKIFSKNKPKE